MKGRLSDAFDRFLEGVADNRQVAFDDDGWRLKTDPAEQPDPAQSESLAELHRWLDARSRTTYASATGRVHSLSARGPVSGQERQLHRFSFITARGWPAARSAAGRDGGRATKELAPSLRCRWRRLFGIPFRPRRTSGLVGLRPPFARKGVQ